MSSLPQIHDTKAMAKVDRPVGISQPGAVAVRSARESASAFGQDVPPPEDSFLPTELQNLEATLTGIRFQPSMTSDSLRVVQVPSALTDDNEKCSPQPMSDGDLKQAARPTTAAATKPGAVQVVGNNVRINEGPEPLDQRESALLSKGAYPDSSSRRGYSDPVEEPGAGLSNMEDTVQRKVQRMGGGNTASSGSGPKGISTLEDSVQRKVHHMGGGTVASECGPEGISTLEDSVQRKVHQMGGSSVPSQVGPEAISSLEDSVQRKVHQMGGSSATSVTSAAMPGSSRMPDSKKSGPAFASGRVGAFSSSRTIGGANQLGNFEANIGGKGDPTNDHDPASTKPAVVTEVPPPVNNNNKNHGATPEQAPFKLPHHMTGPDVEYGVSDPDADSFVNEEGLAVAMPVKDDEEEEDGYIQSAVEYDPDAKPTIQSRRRRFRLYAFLTILALIAVGAGSIIGVIKSDNGGDSKDIVPEVPYRETIGIWEGVERAVGGEVLNDPDSPYSKALQWITHNDTMEVVPASPNFLQRYICAYFYFATINNENGEWLSCNPLGGNQSDDCMYQSLYNIHPVPSYEDIPAKRWLSGQHECAWAGLYCDDSQYVRSIELLGQHLEGPFPDGLHHFPFLQKVSLSWNNLTGSLPEDLMESKHLVDVEAQFNKLSGSIPEKWWSSRMLSRLNIADNQLNGTISPSIGNMDGLRGLYLQKNRLSGPLPTEIGKLTSLSFVYLNSNRLTGPIPNEMATMSALEKLWLHKNDFEGLLPEDIGQISKLGELRLQSNPRLGGSIPDSFYDLKELYRCDLRSCNFSGSLNSSRISQLQKMTDFRLSSNKFSGPLPMEIQDLPLLRDIQLANTDLTGSIPTEMCSRRGAEDGIYRMTADCREDAVGGVTELECDCCTLCCDAVGMNCAPPG